jgi:hypothetical protein
MFIITFENKKTEGAYTVIDSDGNQILYLFEEEDDALRFCQMLEEDGSPLMDIIEVDDELIIKTCKLHNYNYVVFTKNDLVIPPKQNDLI